MTPTPATTTTPKTATPKTAAKPATAPKTATPAKLGKYLPDDQITVLVDNPKKVGSASRSRFALYGEKGATTTVAAFLKAGGFKIDIDWDAAPTRKFIAITRSGSPVA